MPGAPNIRAAVLGGSTFGRGTIYKADIVAGKYRLNGAGPVYSSFTDVPGATSSGGAGHGYVKRGGLWTPVAANAPLVGDTGLLVLSERAELVQYATRPANSGWTNFGATKTVTGLTYQGVFESAISTSQGSNAHRLRNPSFSVTSGQLYTVVARFRAGTSNRARGVMQNSSTSAETIMFVGTIGSLSTGGTSAGTASIVEQVNEGDGVWRVVVSYTPNFTGVCGGSGIGSGSATTGENIEVLGLSVQAGAYIESSVIDTAGSAATRTAMQYSQVLPAGSNSDQITIEYTGGSASFTRGDLSDPLLLPFGVSSGGAWVDKAIQTITVQAA